MKLHWLQRHPLPVTAWFRHSLVLTYAFPEALLRPLLPPGLNLDTHEGFGFLAIALVQTEGLRPAFLPRICGRSFFLSGYRIFARHRTPDGRTLRGLRILRSDTDSRLMVAFGNLLTHYAYRLAQVEWRESTDALEVRVRTPAGAADLEVRVNLAPAPAPLPAGSPFADARQARLFAGPLPFTFDYERETHSLILIEGVRQEWHPHPVNVEVRQATFLGNSIFAGARPVLANAFLVSGIPYRWKRGVREPLPKEAA